MSRITTKKDKGFVILYAVTLVVVILSITMGVSEIALKENNFGTSAKDTDNAFYAADSGIEYTLNNDKVATNYPDPVPGATNSWSLTVTNLGSDNKSCAKITITKDYTVTPMLTTIVADGYNIGDASCNSTNPNRVQRELKMTY